LLEVADTLSVLKETKLLNFRCSWAGGVRWKADCHASKLSVEASRAQVDNGVSVPALLDLRGTVHFAISDRVKDRPRT